MLSSANLLATFLVAMAVIASGSPVEPDRQYDTKFKICEGKYWQDPCCVPDSVVLEKCYDFGSEFNFTNVKSFGPPPDLTCAVFVCVTAPLLIFVISRIFFTRSRCGCAIGPRTALEGNSDRQYCSGLGMIALVTWAET